MSSQNGTGESEEPITEHSRVLKGIAVHVDAPFQYDHSCAGASLRGWRSVPELEMLFGTQLTLSSTAYAGLC